MGDWESWAAGFLAGTSMSLIGHPFDTVKTRMQTSTSHPSASACARHICREEGVSALWKGFAPALLASATTSSIRCGVQAGVNARIARRFGEQEGGSGQDFSKLSLPVRTASEAAGGFAAGLVLPTLFTPLEMVKCRQQTSVTGAGGGAVSSFQIVRDVIRVEGVRGMYVGHTMTLLRSTIANAFLFGPYVVAKDGWAAVLGEDSSMVRPLSGMVAGWSTWLVSFPFDSVKTRMQVAGQSSAAGQSSTVEAVVDLRGMGAGGAHFTEA
jgi:solute carrier family 25 carnitine/acylcarnitine transporter 20/29